MIFGIGVDIVKNLRIARALDRWGKRFLERVLSPQEIALLIKRTDPVPLLAVRFAAKEAFTKALKTGLKEGIRLRDIEMLGKETGEPYLVLRGEAKKRVRELGITNIHVSVSHEREYSVGVVILEK